MAIFTIYQNHSAKDNHDAVNALGWDGAAKQYPGVGVHLDMTCDADKWNPEFFQYYKPVASVATNVEGETWEKLERVFATSNCGGANGDDYVNFDRAHSLSVGDLVRTPEGEFYVVAGCGFTKVEVA